MKSSLMRPALVLALALGLASCGGKNSFTVGGSVQGLKYDGLVLNTNGMDLGVPKDAKTFEFPTQIEYGETYSVTVKNQPEHQSCSVGSGSDTAGRLSSINVAVVCSVQSHKLSGTITGLTADGLELGNGSTVATVKPAAGATTFQFPDVTYGQTYGIVVLHQPDGQTCSVVANGTAEMTKDVTVEVQCVANT